MTTEVNPQAAAAAAAPAPKNNRRKALLILLTVVVVAAIAWTAYYLLVLRWHQDTDDAYVQGNVVNITPQVQGTVVSIGADDGMK
ncbi:EmrA/EmrK family multidrug efflux transporter periplasmic adaptor subunit, partial [Lysobacter sp. 2RAB21]